MEKLLAMNIAATLTGAVISNLADDLTVDVDIDDENLRAENLMTWELFRIFYAAVKGALEDEESWPAPAVTANNMLPGVLQLLQGVLRDSPVVKELLGRLLRAVPIPGLERIFDLTKAKVTGAHDGTST